MSVCCQHEGHHLIFTKGAPENLLPRCTFAIDESGQASIEMSDKLRREWTRVLDQWGGDSALRCVGLAYSAVPDNRARLKPDDESDLVFLGILGLQDPPRPEVADAMQTCFGAGIRVVMLTGAPPAVSPALPPLPPPQLLLRLPPTQPAPLLPLHTQATPVCTCPLQPCARMPCAAQKDRSISAGDNQATANAIARQVGILSPSVDIAALRGKDSSSSGGGEQPVTLTAAQFDAMPPSVQLECVRDLKVFARVEPHHKQSLVEALQAQHEVRASAHGCDSFNTRRTLRAKGARKWRRARHLRKT